MYFIYFHFFFDRNTGAFKSVEEKVGGAYANVKVSVIFYMTLSINNIKDRRREINSCRLSIIL